MNQHSESPTTPLEGPIGVVGGGAVGGWLATQMKNHGWDVSLLLRPNTAGYPEAIDYQVSGVGFGDLRETIPCAAADASGEPLRWLFLALKAGDMEQAAHQLAHRINSDTRLVFPGNGLDLTAPFATLASDRFLVASTTYGLFRESRTQISVRGAAGEISIGPDSSYPSAAEDARHLTAALQALGLRTRQVASGSAVMWQKAILSAGLNPVCALLGIENGQLPASEGFPLALEASSEAIKVASAEGLDMSSMSSPVVIETSLKELCEKTATNRCSMLQDLDSGESTEVNWISGVVVRLGKKNNIPTPVNQLLLDMVKGVSVGTLSPVSLN